MKKKIRKSPRARRSEISWVEHRAVIERRDSVSLSWPQVSDFRDPTLREAFRVWWHPIDMGPDFDELTGQRIRVVGRVPIATAKGGFTVTPGFQLRRRELDPEYYRNLGKLRVRAPRRRAKHIRLRQMPESKMAVKVAIVLYYPLTEKRTKIVTIDRRYPGAIFGLVHDFYLELYAEDERAGGKAGPMNDGKGPLRNRGVGPLVWGHDLGDLGFEGCRYRKFTRAEVKKFVGAEGVFTFDIGS